MTGKSISTFAMLCHLSLVKRNGLLLEQAVQRWHYHEKAPPQT